MAKFEIIGSNELQATFGELIKSGTTAVLKGIHRTAVDILNKAKENLTKGGHRVTGKLYSSGKVAKSQESSLVYDISFGGLAKGEEVAYAQYVEFGRRAGKGLDEEGIKDLTQWVIKKGLADTYSIKTRKRVGVSGAKMEDREARARQIAIWISGRYKKRGRKGTPYLFPAFEEGKRGVEENIKSEFDKLIKSLIVK